VRWLALGLVASLGVACGSTAPKTRSGTARHAPSIRVALAEGLLELDLHVEGRASLRCCGGRTFEWPEPGTLHATFTDGQIELDLGEQGTLRAAGVVLLEPANDSTSVRFGTHSYRGLMEILLKANALTLVNEISLESYLRGVVPWEIGWHGSRRKAAIEAQAIAARRERRHRRDAWHGSHPRRLAGAGVLQLHVRRAHGAD
jgi:hypothetical protein